MHPATQGKMQLAVDAHVHLVVAQQTRAGDLTLTAALGFAIAGVTAGISGGRAGPLHRVVQEPVRRFSGQRQNSDDLQSVNAGRPGVYNIKRHLQVLTRHGGSGLTVVLVIKEVREVFDTDTYYLP